jgi:branched-chain amino acid transport system substrate-binding protein
MSVFSQYLKGLVRGLLAIAVVLPLATACAPPTAAPASPTEAPAEPTEAPAEPTEAPAEPEAGQTIKIGFVYCLSGPCASFGLKAKEAAEIALEEVNAPGNLPDGIEIEALFEDSEFSAQESVNAGRKLIERDEVDVLVPDSSTDTLAVLVLGDQYEIPIVNSLASAVKITESGSDYIFRLIAHEVQQNIFLADFLVNYFGPLPALVGHETTEQGMGQAAAFKEQYTENGGEIIDTISFDPNTPDFSSYATRMIGEEPEMIYLATAITPMVKVCKALEEQGNTAHVVDTVWTAYPTFEELAGSAADGHIRLVFWLPTTDPSLGSELTVSFTERFQEKFDKLPDYNHAQIYDVIKLVADAVKRGGRDRPTMLRALRETDNFQGGVMGPISFQSNGQVELTPDTFTIIRTYEGEVEVLPFNP